MLLGLQYRLWFLIESYLAQETHQQQSLERLRTSSLFLIEQLAFCDPVIRQQSQMESQSEILRIFISPYLNSFSDLHKMMLLRVPVTWVV